MRFFTLDNRLASHGFSRHSDFPPRRPAGVKK
jgi:hypothetical protein